MTVRQSNPFRKIRTEQGLSQYELAKRAGVSKHAVLRLEQGMYDKPLPSVVSYCLRTTEVVHTQLLEDYVSFQVAVREDNSRLLGNILERLEDWSDTHAPVGKHPLTYLREREHLNTTQLAKCLCVSQTIISNFEKHPVQQHSVPAQLTIALQDADYTEEETDGLTKAYNTYRDSIIEGHELKLLPSARSTVSLGGTRESRTTLKSGV